MRREPHSYPWCNLEGVKTATVGEEKGSTKQTLYKQIHSAQPVSLLLNPEGREQFAIYGAIPQQCLYMWCCCNTWKISVISFQEESENNPSLTKAIIDSRKYHSSKPSKQYRVAGDLPFWYLATPSFHFLRPFTCRPVIQRCFLYIELQPRSPPMCPTFSLLWWRDCHVFMSSASNPLHLIFSLWGLQETERCWTFHMNTEHLTVTEDTSQRLTE